MKQELLVYMAEFQVEPTRINRLTETDRESCPTWQPNEQAQAAIESLLLALRYRDWLGDSEKNFLDLLAPPHSVTFLIRNREYLHPEDVPLFPMDLIETALDGGGQAIFTHRYEPQHKTDYDCYKVHTARISPMDREELILGTLGPDNLYGSPAQEDRFGWLVELFRKAWFAADEPESRIAGRLEGTDPILLINRASGRVLAANQQLAEMMATDLRSIVDTEYSEFSRQLSAKSCDMRLKLENLASDPIQLCMATVLPIVRAREEKPSDGLIADFFIHTMRNKLAGITAAASHLGSLAEEVDARDEIELSDIVLGEATQLDRELDRLLTMIAYDRLPNKDVVIAGSLAKAIDNVLARESARATIICEKASSKRVFESPPPALSLLFESALFSHLRHQRQESQTRIVLEEDPQHTTIHLHTEMDRPNPELVLNAHWRTCALRLAVLMDCSLSQEVTAENNGFSSTLRIPNNE